MERMFMGAEVDKTEKSFFIIDKPELNLGAVASGTPNYTDNLSLGLLYGGQLMTDVFFYERIIESLYEINYESLQAVGHFNLPPAS
jgi:hypothetical protein